MGLRHPFGLAIVAAALSAALLIATDACAFDEGVYPDFSGVWRKPPGIGNEESA